MAGAANFVTKRLDWCGIAFSLSDFGMKSVSWIVGQGPHLVAWSCRWGQLRAPPPGPPILFATYFYPRFKLFSTLRVVRGMFFSFQQFNVFLIYSAQFNWNFYDILSTPDFLPCVACGACCFIFSRNFEIISRSYKMIS